MYIKIFIEREKFNISNLIAQVYVPSNSPVWKSSWMKETFRIKSNFITEIWHEVLVLNSQCVLENAVYIKVASYQWSDFCRFLNYELPLFSWLKTVFQNWTIYFYFYVVQVVWADYTLSRAKLTYLSIHCLYHILKILFSISFSNVSLKTYH